MAKNNKDQNFLDFVPLQSSKYNVEKTDDGVVTIFVENKGPFNWFAQTFFGKPRYSQVHLEEYGSFIWPLIDGKKTVKEIADIVKEHFGDKAEPVYPRVSMYFKMLRNYEFITWEEK